MIILALRQAWRTLRDGVWLTLREVGRNVFGFLLFFMAASFLAVGVRAGMEKVLGWGPAWLALAFLVVLAGVWGQLLGLVDKKHLRNPDGRVLPSVALGVMVGGAVVWVYIFAAVSYVLSLLGVVQYAAPGRPEDLLYKLTDAYAWNLLDLLPGLNITSALGWKCPVDLQGDFRRGLLLVLFRAAVIFQIFAKGRELLKKDEPAKP